MLCWHSARGEPSGRRIAGLPGKVLHRAARGRVRASRRLEQGAERAASPARSARKLEAAQPRLSQRSPRTRGAMLQRRCAGSKGTTPGLPGQIGAAGLGGAPAAAASLRESRRHIATPVALWRAVTRRRRTPKRPATARRSWDRTRSSGPRARGRGGRAAVPRLLPPPCRGVAVNACPNAEQLLWIRHASVPTRPLTCTAAPLRDTGESSSQPGGRGLRSGGRAFLELLSALPRSGPDPTWWSNRELPAELS